MLRDMKMHRHLLLLLVLSVVSACGGPDSAEPSLSVLNRGISSDPESLDAHKARSLQAADVLRDLGEGLVSFTATGELTPGAAASWDVSEDGLTYTFHLRADAKWSNGDADLGAGGGR
jgi:ABC-type oligopeptide transport system substrate-binding subunit